MFEIPAPSATLHHQVEGRNYPLLFRFGFKQGISKRPQPLKVALAPLRGVRGYIFEG
jgi:hypothetical protein